MARPDPLAALRKDVAELHAEVSALRQLVGSESRSRALFDRLLMPLDSPLVHDHDVIPMVSVDQRRWLDTAARREKAREEKRDRRLLNERRRDVWWTRWGVRAGTLAAGATLGLAAIDAVQRIADAVQHIMKGL